MVDLSSSQSVARFLNAELPESDVYITLILELAPESKNSSAAYEESRHNRGGRTPKPLMPCRNNARACAALYEAAE